MCNVFCVYTYLVLTALTMSFKDNVVVEGQVSGMFVFKVINGHMGVFSWPKGLKFGHSLHLYLSLVCASIKESAQVRKLVSYPYMIFFQLSLLCTIKHFTTKLCKKISLHGM